jgi:transcription-repair coupling factor (superfamily II helicase)
MISRFRTAKEQKVILEKVAEGKVDILIGTHRILSKDLKFQDLGLLIVDEEQRFGVRHKERLKQMRAAIDVLAMSATPIPRTLHMSLIGLRDMSVIETPPKDRMAIQTIVAKFDEKLVRTAIEIEMERGGQTYFVHNRVETIYEIAAKIRELVPSARVVIGHGQLPETELERVMLAFMNQSCGQAWPERVVSTQGPCRAQQSPGVQLPAYTSGEGVDGDLAAQACRVEGVLRPRRRIQNCGARSGVARRGQHAGR